MGGDEALATAIARAETIIEVGAACQQVTAALGFHAFVYGFRVPLPLLQPSQIILSSYPQEWLAHYDRESYLAIDPVLQRGLASVSPFTWEELDRSDPRVAQLFREAATHGLVHGISVAVHGSHGEGGLFSMARTRPLPNVHEQLQGLFQRLQWFTGLIHERLARLIFIDSEPHSRGLTRRERECLQRAAEGHSAGDIGKDMQITERTVVFHLNRAEEKLGVHRRQHAVAKAVALGEIGPKIYPDKYTESRKLVQVPLRKKDKT